MAWWLRSPNPNNSYNVREVDNDGNTNTNNNAYNRDNAIAPDCETCQLVVSHLGEREPNRRALTQGAMHLPVTGEQNTAMRTACGPSRCKRR